MHFILNANKLIPLKQFFQFDPINRFYQLSQYQFWLIYFSLTLYVSPKSTVFKSCFDPPSEDFAFFLFLVGDAFQAIKVYLRAAILLFTLPVNSSFS